ncbi:MAG: RNA polymerase sigma factor RpoE [Aureliella sp.]
MLSEDTKTIASVLAGNSAAFSKLVEKYQRRLLGLMIHACGDRQLAEDMTQEAFARAYQKLSTYSGEAQFYTWLARVAMNLLASSTRRKRLENQNKRESMDVVADSLGDEVPPSESLELSETQRAVRDAIEQLDPQRREVLLLRDFDSMDYDAIATTLDIPIGTVRSRLHRARCELKEILQPRLSELGLGDNE